MTRTTFNLQIIMIGMRLAEYSEDQSEEIVSHERRSHIMAFYSSEGGKLSDY